MEQVSPFCLLDSFQFVKIFSMSKISFSLLLLNIALHWFRLSVLMTDLILLTPCFCFLLMHLNGVKKYVFLKVLLLLLKSFTLFTCICESHQRLYAGL